MEKGQGLTSSASRTHHSRASRRQHTANRCQRSPRPPDSRLSRFLLAPIATTTAASHGLPLPPPPKSTRHDPATHTTCPCPRGPRTAHACLSKHALYRFRCRRRRSVVVSRAAGDPPPSARVRERESNHHTTAAGLYEGRATAHPHPRLHQFARAASAAPSL